MVHNEQSILSRMVSMLFFESLSTKILLQSSPLASCNAHRIASISATRGENFGIILAQTLSIAPCSFLATTAKAVLDRKMVASTFSLIVPIEGGDHLTFEWADIWASGWEKTREHSFSLAPMLSMDACRLVDPLRWSIAVRVCHISSRVNTMLSDTSQWSWAWHRFEGGSRINLMMSLVAPSWFDLNPHKAANQIALAIGHLRKRWGANSTSMLQRTHAESSTSMQPIRFSLVGRALTATL